VVVVLNGCDRHDPAGSLDLGDRDLRDADVPDLAALSILVDGGEALLNGSLGVDAVQVVESDAVGAQSTEALFDFGAKDLRPSATGAAASSALRRDDAMLGFGGERRTDRLFAL